MLMTNIPKHVLNPLDNPSETQSKQHHLLYLTFFLTQRTFSSVKCRLFFTAHKSYLLNVKSEKYRENSGRGITCPSSTLCYQIVCVKNTSSRISGGANALGGTSDKSKAGRDD